MKSAKVILIFLFMLPITAIWAALPVLSEKDLNSSPPRIIRVCCAFGTDLHLLGIPFIKINQITSIEKMGPHHYLGNIDEQNGILYTRNGGFIDMGHTRDVADWTAYLYSLILYNKGKGEFTKQLGYEGGSKVLTINVKADVDSMDCLSLAGKIAYDLSLWHEISTWFGASTIPGMPERYSSFSIEDVYSNLLGVIIGTEAIKSNLPYDEAMTKLIMCNLDSLGSVKTEEDTYNAFEEVKNIWWTNDKRLPSRKILIERDTEVFPRCHPWLIPGRLESNIVPKVLNVPMTAENGQSLSGFYKLSIDLNFKFPVKEIFPERNTREITQDDFQAMINRVDLELKSEEPASYSNTETHDHEMDKNRL
jgi:hypothetical protein